MARPCEEGCPCNADLWTAEWYEYHDAVEERYVPDSPSLSDYRNEEGEWLCSPEQIRADMNWQPDPADWYDDY